MQVIYEPLIDAHAPTLYRAARTMRPLPGWSAVGVEQLAQYERDGFLVIGGALSADEVAAARDELRDMTLADDPRCDIMHYEGALRRKLPQLPAAQKAGGLAMGEKSHRLPELDRHERAPFVRKLAGFVETHEPLRAIAFKPELIRLAEHLVRGPVRLFQDMAMIKPPGGREKPWHQDHAYFNLAMGTRIVGVWIALDDVDAVNGCMHVLAGGHRLGPQCHFMRRDWQICDDHILGKPITALPMKAGDAMFFDALLPHGTPTNFSDKTRWAIQLHYVPREAPEIPERERLAVFGGEGRGVSC